MDLVVGATGAVGKQITLQLLKKKRKLRALIRGGKGREESKSLMDLGAEIADGDLTLIETATKSGVREFIYTSYSGRITEDSPLETAKRDCEKRLLVSALQAVILRLSYFMEAWLSP